MWTERYKNKHCIFIHTLWIVVPSLRDIRWFWTRLVAVHFVVDFLQFSKTCKCRKVCLSSAMGFFLCNERYKFGAWSYCCGDKKKYEATLYLNLMLHTSWSVHFWFLSPCAYHATCSGNFCHKTQKNVFPEQINANVIKSEFEDPVYRTLWIWICTSDVCFTWVLLLRKSRVVLRGTLERERERVWHHDWITVCLGLWKPAEMQPLTINGQQNYSAETDLYQSEWFISCLMTFSWCSSRCINGVCRLEVITANEIMQASC